MQQRQTDLHKHLFYWADITSTVEQVQYVGHYVIYI